MAAVSRSDYPDILRLVDVEGEKTSEVARRYGVVPRTINIILGKARAAAAAPAAVGDAAPSDADPAAAPTEPVPIPMQGFEAGRETPVAVGEREIANLASVPEKVAAEPAEAAALDPTPELPPEAHREQQAIEAPLPSLGHPRPRTATAPAPVARERPVRSLLKGSGATSARSAGVKAAWGLVVKGEDGDENVAPFGSIDELLAAAKGVLRKAAAGDERVWLSVSRVDPSDYPSGD